MMISSSFFFWAVPAVLLLAALSGLLFWKGRAWIGKILHAGRKPSMEQTVLSALRRLGLSGRTLSVNDKDMRAIEFSYRQVCFILELSRTDEGEKTTLVVPNLHQGYLRDMDRILFCLNRFNCHPHLSGRAIAALVRDGNQTDGKGQPELDVRILHPVRFSGNARRDASRLKKTLESMVTSIMWLLSLVDKLLLSEQGLQEETASSAADEQQRLQEVMDYLNPAHLPS